MPRQTVLHVKFAPLKTAEGAVLNENVTLKNGQAGGKEGQRFKMIPKWSELKLYGEKTKGNMTSPGQQNLSWRWVLCCP